MLIAGDERLLAQWMTQIQNSATSNALPWLPWVFMQAQAARQAGAKIIGMTGAPGAGKSTLLRALLEQVHDESVGVLLIDPSSPFTGGALLGDRLRMDQAIGPRHFVRSVGTRGHLGGLCQAARDLVRLYLAAGKRYVFVETVGVGQSEVEVMNLADVTTVVLTPDSGDVIQTLKAGLLEIADCFVVNKADHDDADRMVQDLRALDDSRAIIKTVATRGEGVAELWNVLRGLQSRRSAGAPRQQLAAETLDLALAGQRVGLEKQLRSKAGGKLLAQIEKGVLSPYEVATRLRQGKI